MEAAPIKNWNYKKQKQPPLNGETDLGQIRNFVASHIEELPEEQLFIVEKINFLIQKHNQAVKNYKPIELIPKSAHPLSFREELESHLETFFLERKIPEEKQVAFWEQVEEVLAKSSKSKWDEIALLVENTALFSDEEKTSLKHHLGTTFNLTEFSDELLLKISYEKSLSFAGVSKHLQNIFLHPSNQEQLLKNFEQIRRIWPPFADETPTLEKNQAILAKIKELFSKDELKQILNGAQFNGSIEQIEAINEAYQKQEEALVVLCEAIIIQKNLPHLPGNSLSEKAEAARTWINDPNHQTILESIQGLDLSNKGISCIPKEIEKLSSLKVLSLDNNQISSLVGATLPSSLEQLSLNNNQISSLEGATLPSSLKRLYLLANPLPPGATVPGLSNLQISQ